MKRRRTDHVVPLPFWRRWLLERKEAWIRFRDQGRPPVPDLTHGTTHVIFVFPTRQVIVPMSRADARLMARNFPRDCVSSKDGRWMVDVRKPLF